MADHEPTIQDDGDQDGEALDAELLPEEFPEDRPLASRDYGTTEAEQARRESLDGRLRREEPDFGQPSAFDDDADDDDEGVADEGVADEGVADEGVADEGVADLLSELDDDGRDLEKELVSQRTSGDRHADDSGQPRSPRSAEEDAVHLVDEDELVADEGDEDDGRA